MEPDVIDLGIDNGLRRWCETCRRYTRSIMVGSDEQCAEHDDEYDDDDW